MIKIIVENLTIEGVEYIGTTPATFLTLSDDDTFTISKPIEYDFRASIAAGDVIIQGFTKTTITGNCGKCLVTCEEVIESDICCYFEGARQGELDISEQVREEISITLPATLVCSDNCSGLCHKCGINLNLTKCKCNDAKQVEFPEENIWGKLDDLKIDN